MLRPTIQGKNKPLPHHVLQAEAHLQELSLRSCLQNERSLVEEVARVR